MKRFPLIQAVTGGTGGTVELGGLVGRNGGIIRNSNATGAVTVSTGDYNYVGGLVGANNYSGTVQNSNAAGVVSMVVLMIW